MTVQLLLPETPPTFDKDVYEFGIAENVEGVIIGNITIGDINEASCDGQLIHVASIRGSCDHQ